MSDPRDKSGCSAWDLITMGFVNTPEAVALVEGTPALGDSTPTDTTRSSSAGSRPCSRFATTRR